VTPRSLIVVPLLGITFSGARAVLAAPSEAAPAASVAQEKPEFCEDYYEGHKKPKDFAKALSCYRKWEVWLWVAIMQVNGEGTPIDLAGAQASLDRLEFKDADALALERIIKQRAASLSPNGPRVDFCKDLANTTNSVEVCDYEEQGPKTSKDGAQLRKVRVDLDPNVRPAFDRARTAFERFSKAEGDRVYQQYIDGTARGQEAIAQEAFARRNFLATLKLLITGPAKRLAARKQFLKADRDLNVVYNHTLSSYGEFSADDDVRDFKMKSRAAQHEWIRYRDAMAELAVALWPTAADVREQAKARVTEDRIRELRGK
jgi:uncharacterized protein YecT (DUF1311 family)